MNVDVNMWVHRCSQLYCRVSVQRGVFKAQVKLPLSLLADLDLQERFTTHVSPAKLDIHHPRVSKARSRCHKYHRDRPRSCQVHIVDTVHFNTVPSIDWNTWVSVTDRRWSANEYLGINFDRNCDDSHLCLLVSQR